MENLIDILAFRLGGYQFNVEDQQRLHAIAKLFTIKEINTELCTLECPENVKVTRGANKKWKAETTSYHERTVVNI